MEYRKKPVIVEAKQWHEDGDHAQVSRMRGGGSCGACKLLMNKHGWVDTLEGGHVVCPGDFIITGVKGEHYPCKLDIFKLTYEPVE